MKIHFVRHGKTEANEREQFQGHNDTPLTEAGKQNARNVANMLENYEYDIIFSSPLKRALDTSKLLAQQLRTDIRIDPGLKEICYGDWEGKAKDELREHDLWKQRKRDKYNFTHPGVYNGVEGQSYADIFERVTAFCRQLSESDYELVLVVTHLGVLRNLKKRFEDCSDRTAVSFTPDVRQIYQVTIKDDYVNTKILDLK
jgi:broad specificity phosphatase PhoE